MDLKPGPSLCGWLMLLDEDGNRHLLLEGGRAGKYQVMRPDGYLGKGIEMEQRVTGKEQKLKVPSSIRHSSLKNHRVGRDVSAASEQGHLVLVEPHLVV